MADNTPLTVTLRMFEWEQIIASLSIESANARKRNHYNTANGLNKILSKIDDARITATEQEN